VVTQGEDYGRSTALNEMKINLEFVSANPTGPVHLGHTRWAAVGDSLGRILAAAGAEVTREHYTNDAGAQLERFGRSLKAAADGKPTPEDGYGGEYIQDIATKIKSEHDDPTEETYREEGYRLMLAEMKASLERFNVHFDVWFSERSLHEGGAVEHALEVLRKQGHIYEHEGATWLRTTEFGDDKDRVIVRSNGEKTYFAADCAYYINKRERGFERCVYLLGADHHGYVGRLKAIAACAGDDPNHNIQVLIGQLVNLMRGGDPVRLSKRAGTIITLDELVDVVGVDAARYSLARSSTDSPLTLDIDEISPAGTGQPGLLRAVRPRPHREPAAQRRRDGHRQGRFQARTARTREGNRTPQGRRRLPTGGHHRGRTQRAPPRGPLPRGTGDHLPPVLRQLPRLPRGDEAPTDLTRARLWLVEAARIVLGQRPGPARGQRTRTDVGKACAHTKPALCTETWEREGRPGSAHRRTSTHSNRRCGRRRSERSDAGSLTIGGLDVRDLAAAHGTPAYLLDEADVRERCRRFRDAFKGADVFYAGKAFLCKAMVRIIAEEGLHLDVCSGGELATALAAGFPPERIGLHGNNKSPPNCARRREQRRPDRRRLVRGDRAPHRHRTRNRDQTTHHGPRHRRRGGAHPRVHRHRARGPEVRFLLFGGAASAAVEQIIKADVLELTGLHSHIGSQIFDVSGFELSARRLLQLHKQIRDQHQRELPEMDLGGGFGIAYTTQDDPAEPADLGAALFGLVKRECDALGIRPAADQHRTGPGDRRPGHVHAVRGGHRQGRRRDPHLRQRRRRDERQHPHGAVRLVLQRAPSPAGPHTNRRFWPVSWENIAKPAT
jgi:arginyl-tRNA synthetase